jgi:hypothetical protein
VTIHYQWHPFFKRSLIVVRRCPRFGSEYVFCELPDGTVCAVPCWMTDAAMCVGHSLEPAQASVGALVELRRLLDAAAPTTTSSRVARRRVRARR